MKNVLTLMILLLAVAAFGQATGKIDYKHLGLSFTIPNGWAGQETEMGYLMASQTVPGVILLLPHDQQYSLEQIKAQAQAGLNEGNGTNLQLSGSLTNVGKNAVGGTFTGTLEWQPAKAFIIGMRNPYGIGLSVVAVTTTEHFTDKYEGYAKAIHNSVTFRKPEAKEDIGEWKEWLKNVKLTYMETYSSGSSGGYSLNRKIDLCGAGYFIYYGSSNFSIDIDNSSAYSHSNSNGNGTWDIQVGADGNPVLVLNYNNGETASYTLTFEDKKLYLNGSRYFRTMEGEHAPNCN